MMRFSRVRLSKRSVNLRIPYAQTLAEFALILPILLMVIFMVIELARVLHAWLAIENGARFGVRYAVTGEYNPEYCPDGKCVTVVQTRYARLRAIHDAAWAGSASILRVMEGEVGMADPSFFQVSICPADKLIKPDPTEKYSTYRCQPDENPGEPGEHVIVVVEFNHPLLSPFLSTVWPQLRISAMREAIVESYRVNRPYKMPTGQPAIPATATQTPTTKATATTTPTATITATSTPTPTPDCDLIYIDSGLRFDGADLRMRVRNDNPMVAYLIRSEFQASQVKNSPPAYLDWISFSGRKLYDPGNAVYLSPSADINVGSLWIAHGVRAHNWWEADFNETVDPVSGQFVVVLMLQFSDWPEVCTVMDSVYTEMIPTSTPRPTFTPRPTRTPGPTETSGPSPTPRATNTPRPTRTPKPTDTKGPTSTPRPTNTTQPTPTESGGSPEGPPD